MLDIDLILIEPTGTRDKLQKLGLLQLGWSAYVFVSSWRRDENILLLLLKIKVT
jgi:hypothetical protein